MKRFLWLLIGALSLMIWACGDDDSPTQTDTTAPAAITTLAIIGPVDSTCSLGWVAPGDDLHSGTAESYDIRYATDSIRLLLWNNATVSPNPPTPGQSGALHYHTVHDLVPDSVYFFAIKTTDDAGNVSDISNVVKE